MRKISDAKIWTLDGMPMTVYDRSSFHNIPSRGKCSEDLTQWLDEHCEGKWVITPTVAAFEYPHDALIFKLGFK